MSLVLAVNGAQMDSAGVCVDAARLRGVASEAVARTCTAITLSLFSFVGRSVDAIITSNRMDHGHKGANG